MQGTATADSFVGPVLFLCFKTRRRCQQTGVFVAVVSNGNLSGNNNDDGSGHGNAEVYIGSFNGGTFAITRQATRTKLMPVARIRRHRKCLSPGRRLSRDGSLVALISGDDPKANATTNQTFLAVFVFIIAQDRFDLVGRRATAFPGDVIHFPTFTDYNASLVPGTLIYASALNFKTDGTFPPAAEDSTGLNPSRSVQVFSTALPITATNTFRRITKNTVFAAFSPLSTATIERTVFSAGGAELGVVAILMVQRKSFIC